MAVPIRPREGQFMPGWLRPDDDGERREARLGAHDTIEYAVSLFKGIAEPETSEFPLKQVSGRYEQEAASVYADTLYQILNCLFGNYQKIYDGDNEVNQWCVQAIPNSNLLDLGHFLARLQKSASTGEWPSQGEVADFLDQWITDVRAFLGSARPGSSSAKAAMNRWALELAGVQTDLAASVSAANSARSAEEYAERAKRASTAAQRSAGQTGALVLGTHFRDIARAEQVAERNWTVGVLVALLVTLLLGSVVVLDYSPEVNNWTATLFHLALVLPVVGAASYASRIARHHRMLARWAKTASVQVNSIEAFAQQLNSDENRDALILQLGHNVFGSPYLGDETLPEHFSTIPPEVVELLKEVASKLRVTPGKP